MTHALFALWLLVGIQTHPCDVATSNTATVYSDNTLVVEFCSPAADNITGMCVYVNGVYVFCGPAIRLTEEPNSSIGHVLYRGGPFGTLARGTYDVQVTAYNLDPNGVEQGGPLSDPFWLSVVDRVVIPIPAAPTIKAVRP